MAADSLGTTGASLGTPVDVDNHRPNAGQAASSGTPVVHATNQLTWTVTPTVSPTAPSGTTVTDVELDSPGPALPVTHFVKNADGTWTVSVDTSALDDGVYAIAAVAMDSNGVVSSPLTANMVIDRSFTLTAPTQTVVTPDWSNLDLSYSYPGNWAACNGYTGAGYVGPSHIELQVDGAVWQYLPVYNIGAFGRTPSGTCLLPVLGGSSYNPKPLPYGKHTLTWVVTDSNGVQESVDQPVTVAAPLTATWPTGSETLVTGSTIHVAPTVSSPDGFSTLQSWTVTDQNGNTLASGTGATPPALSLATPAAQETGGRLTLNLVSSAGLTTTQSFTYQTGWQTAAFAGLSATSAVKGTWVKLSSSAWAKVNGKWINPGVQAHVQYQWSVPGSGVWHNGSAYPVGPTTAPLPTTWIKAGSNACFRAVYTEEFPLTTSYGTDLIPATSAPVCLTVKP
ncbi:flagellar hook protein FlgE [Streptacidiphilus fuscans]|uniref:Bacterial Ig-like domain-containing protein n=1 Tax=Streptacidiphilus fuscans TaxID=2789292 RepID=A0A931FDG2_9ACTN|nr:hypothetical protein [Streptacidiphilus fuscans]MBF9068120.1 hypothetical protein [Streptacidiphilus fuscans]